MKIMARKGLNYERETRRRKENICDCLVACERVVYRMLVSADAHCSSVVLAALWLLSAAGCRFSSALLLLHNIVTIEMLTVHGKYILVIFVFFWEL